MRNAWLSPLTIVCLLLAVAPTMADTTLYSNGPINGTTDAWTINSGFSVSDSFTLGSDPKVRDLHIGVWLFPGDTLSSQPSVTSVQMDLGTMPFGTDVSSGVILATGFTDLGINQLGFDVQQIDFTFGDIEVAPGSYWLTLSNAVVPSGDPVYWDENSGVGCTSPGCPSTAFESSVGSIPSESFTLTGTKDTTPEPSSIMLFGSGILGVAAVLRRRL